MRLVKRGRVGGLRGPGLAPADLALIDGKVDEAAGYAATAAAQLPAVIAAKDDALDDIAAGVAIIDGKIDEAEAAQAAAGAQAAIATQQALAAQIAVGALGRPVVCDSVAFPRNHGQFGQNDYVGIFQPSAGLVGAFGGDCDMFFISSFPHEMAFGNISFLPFGLDGTNAINLSGELRAKGYNNVPATEPSFEWKMSGNGAGNAVSVTMPLTRIGRRMMQIVSRRGTTVTARYINLDDPTVIVDGASTTNASFIGCNALRNSGIGGGMMIGGWGYNSASGPPYNDGIRRYWPGDMEIIAISANGSPISDANLLAIAAGADPVALLGGGVWKFYRDFSDGVTATSLAKPASVTSDTTTPATIVRGTGSADIRKGPTIRRQSQTKYLLNDYVEYGYLWATPVAQGRKQARVRLKGKVAGLSATSANNVRVTSYRRDGSVLWTKVIGKLAVADTTYDFSFDAPFTQGYAPMDIEIDGDTTLRCSIGKRIGVGYSVILKAQSQGNQAMQYVDQGLKAQLNSTVSYVGIRGENDLTSAVEGTLIRHIVGESYNSDGLVGFTKRWSELTDAPIVVIEEAVGGTSALALLLDVAATVPDLRSPGSFINFHANDGAQPLAFNVYSRSWAQMIVKIDYACGKVVTAIMHDWISADNAGLQYPDMISRPLYFGEGRGMIHEYTHYVYDGLTYANQPTMILIPANRHLQNPLDPVTGNPSAAAAGPFASGHVVLPTYGQGRDAQVNWWKSVGGVVAPQRHALRNEMTTNFGGLEGGPHISHAAGAEPGNFLNGQIYAEGCGRAFGLSMSQDPYILQLEWEDASHLALLVRFKLPNAGRLRTYRNLDDGAGKVVVRGFDANWSGSAATADWSAEEADSTKGLIARLIPGTARNSRDCVRITRPDGSAIPNTFKLTYMYGAPMDFGYNGDGFNRVLDTIYDGAPFADGLGYSAMSSPGGSTLKEWTIADVVASS